MHAVTRAALPALLAGRRPAGHVIDCIGLTGDFRLRPLDTAEAHVGLVGRCLAQLRLDRFSCCPPRASMPAPVHARGCAAACDSRRSVRSLQPDQAGRRGAVPGRSAPGVRVARLSNVYGAGMPAETFLGQVLREGSATGARDVPPEPRAPPRTTSASPTWCGCCRRSPTAGRHRLYNVAAGRNTTHDAIAERAARTAGWHIAFATDAPTVRAAAASTSTRLEAEFGPRHTT